MPLTVVTLRRFPVKSMGGESVQSVDLDARGLVGDRWFAVEDEDGHFASGKSTRRFRRRDAIFNYSATTISGSVVVRRADHAWRVGDPEADRELSEAMGTPVRLTPEGSVRHQDAGQVSLVGTASIAWCREHLGVEADARRLRANLVVETTTPFVEESWIGARLAIGGAALRVVAQTERCRMIDLAQDGVGTTTPWLKALAKDRRCRLGVYADVASAGRISVGDEVLVQGSAVRSAWP